MDRLLTLVPTLQELAALKELMEVLHACCWYDMQMQDASNPPGIMSLRNLMGLHTLLSMLAKPDDTWLGPDNKCYVRMAEGLKLIDEVEDEVSHVGTPEQLRV